MKKIIGTILGLLALALVWWAVMAQADKLTFLPFVSNDPHLEVSRIIRVRYTRGGEPYASHNLVHQVTFTGGGHVTCDFAQGLTAVETPLVIWTDQDDVCENQFDNERTLGFSGATLRRLFTNSTILRSSIGCVAAPDAYGVGAVWCRPCFIQSGEETCGQFTNLPDITYFLPID